MLRSQPLDLLLHATEANVVADALLRINGASQPSKESLELLYLYVSWSEMHKKLQSD